MANEHDEVMRPSTAEFEAHFFAGAEKVKVEIELLSETVEAVRSLAAENDWEEAAVVGAGIGYLRGERALHVTTTVDRFSAGDMQRLLNRLIDLESMYAVLKFRTFGFLRDNQTLELHAAALRTSTKALEMTVDRLRAENDRLKAEVELLRNAPVTSSTSPIVPPKAESPAPRGWRRQVGRWLGII